MSRAETRSAAELFAGTSGGAGYLLKDRVAYVRDLIDTIARVAEGGTILDPEVARHLLSASRRADALAALSPREREVLLLVARGCTNAAIASAFTISPRVMEKHVASIFTKLGLAASGLPILFERLIGSVPREADVSGGPPHSQLSIAEHVYRIAVSSSAA